MPNALNISPPPAPEMEVLIDLWLDQSSASDRDPIGIKGEPSYRYFWSTFTRYLKTGKNGLLPHALSWQEVTPVDVLGFLESGPSSRKTDSKVSDITRRRYWRLLERIYDFALQNGWVASNPVREIVKDEQPRSEDPKGAIMSPSLWKALQQCLHPLPPEDDFQALRNRALLICISELALSPMEVRNLKMNSILYIEEEGVRRPQALQLDGPGPNQRRRVHMEPFVVEALESWLAVRDDAASSPQVEFLFCTTRRNARNPNAKPPGQMTPVTLLDLVRTLIEKAARESNQPLPARLGPQILRNTRLVMWLNAGVPASTVAVWAGLKNIKGLYHLRDHLNPEVRITVKSVRDDAT